MRAAEPLSPRLLLCTPDGDQRLQTPDAALFQRPHQHHLRRIYCIQRLLDEADDEVLLAEPPAGALLLPLQMVLDAVEQRFWDLERSEERRVGKECL